MPVVLAAALLALIPLAVAPLIIHWLTRGRAVPRSFPALALLTRSAAGRASRDRLREAVVLSLRCLAVLLVVLAIAGLAWRGGLGGGARPAVIILDASASMRQATGGATAFDRARASASDLIDGLSGRPAAVIIGSRQPRGTGAPNVEHGRLRALLAEAAPAWDDGDPAAAVASATALMPQGGDILFVTDLSRGALSGLDPGSLPKGISLTAIDAGGGGENGGITGLAIEPGVLIAGREALLSARIANYGTAPLRVRVSLEAGQAGSEVALEVPPGSSLPANLRFTPRQPGTLIVKASLLREDGSADALPGDDARSGVITVVPQLDAVIASDGPRGDVHGPALPLAAGLGAAGFAVRLSDGPGLAAALAPADGHAAPALLATAGLAVGSDPGATLRTWMERGGCWLQVISGDGDAALAQVGGAPAPVALGAAIDVSAQERGAQGFAAARLEHPLFSAFAGREAMLRAVGTFRYRLAAQAPAVDATVLLAYADGTPALVERPVGAGRWLLLNCSTAAADGTLAASEALPVLCSRLPAAMLPSRGDRLADDCGTRHDGLDWKDAAGRPAPLHGGGSILDQPGAWSNAAGLSAAAAIPAVESDLRRVDPARLGVKALLASEGSSALSTAPLWPWCLAAALLLLTVEALLMGGIARRRP